MVGCECVSLDSTLYWHMLKFPRPDGPCMPCGPAGPVGPGGPCSPLEPLNPGGPCLPSPTLSPSIYITQSEYCKSRVQIWKNSIMAWNNCLSMAKYNRPHWIFGSQNSCGKPRDIWNNNCQLKTNMLLLTYKEHSKSTKYLF